MAFKFFKNTETEAIAHSLYVEIVSQARKPQFYVDLGVPDTTDGRFDMILLHAYLLFRRLKDDGDRANEISQSVFDLMFADMDQNLREMGVGDIGVSHRIKGMIKAFYGRVSVYDKGVAETTDSQLSDALKRNLYRKSEPQDEQVLKIVHYIRREIDTLAKQDTQMILEGRVQFSDAPTAEKVSL
jgi:cytochrome b pre-mRNA-processing protein 3